MMAVITIAVLFLMGAIAIFTFKKSDGVAPDLHEELRMKLRIACDSADFACMFSEVAHGDGDAPKRKEMYEMARQELRTALGFTWLLEGVHLFQAGNYTSALSAAEEAITTDIRNAEFASFRICCFRALQDTNALAEQKVWYEGAAPKMDNRERALFLSAFGDTDATVECESDFRLAEFYRSEPVP